MALQAGIEPASTVPETAILSIRLLEHLISFNLVIIHYRLRACQHEPDPGPASATNASATVQLYSASESEAIYELKKRGTIGHDKDVIILSITPI